MAENIFCPRSCNVVEMPGNYIRIRGIHLRYQCQIRSLPCMCPQLPAVMPPNLEPRFVSSIHSTPMHVRFFSASNDWPWPLGFFPLLQSYAMDNLAELTQDRTAEQPHSYTEALSWNCGQQKRADVRHARPGRDYVCVCVCVCVCVRVCACVLSQVLSCTVLTCCPGAWGPSLWSL